MPTVAAPALTRAAHALLAAMGSADAEAATVADHLVAANLKGHDSHGVGMIPHYVRNWQADSLVLNGTLRLVRDEGPILVADGGGAHGQVMARELTNLAVARATAEGVAVAALINAHHIGRVGYYGERAADAGLVSLHFVNVAGHRPSVAPFGGAAARFITNPVCIAVPAAGDHPPTILDFATSEVAMGKVRVAMNEGRPMPEGFLIDNAGRPTTDPSVMFPAEDVPVGALMPFGRHKGYGLSLMAELLAAALTGGLTIPPDPTETANGWDKGIRNSMLMIVIDPARLAGRDAFGGDVARVLDWVKSVDPADPDVPVLVAGDPERAREAERLAAGIAIDEATWAEILAAADSVGLGGDAFEKLATEKLATGD